MNKIVMLKSLKKKISFKQIQSKNKRKINQYKTIITLVHFFVFQAYHVLEKPVGVWCCDVFCKTTNATQFTEFIC